MTTQDDYQPLPSTTWSGTHHLLAGSLDLIPLDEVCALFDCKEDRVVRMLRAGELPGIKLGRDWRIPRAAFWQAINDLAIKEAGERASAPVALSTVELAAKRGPGRPRIQR